LVTLNLSDFIETHGRIMQPRKFQNHGYSLSYRPVGGFLPEDVRQAGLRPFDSSRSFRESEQSTLHPQAEPSQKPFLVAFDNHRPTADSDDRNDGLVLFESCTEPVGPFWGSRKAVNLSQRHPHEHGIGVRQNRAPGTTRAIDEFLGNSDQVAQWSFSVRNLQGSSVSLGIPPE